MSETLRAALQDGATTARAVVDALHRDVQSFAAGTEPADDITVLVLRWTGPGMPGGVPAGA